MKNTKPGIRIEYWKYHTAALSFEQARNVSEQLMVIGRTIYSMRLAVGEPPFAHIRSVIGQDKFTLRTKRKVSKQWNLFCIVHNLKKSTHMELGLPRFGQCREGERPN